MKGRFGRLAVFHELIGYPSCRGWVDDDYLDWATAFYRQNPDTTITAKNLDNLSALGVGPSRQSIYSNFGSLVKFQDLSKQYQQMAVDDEQLLRQQRLVDIMDLANYEDSPAQAIYDLEQPKDHDRILQISAQFRIAKYFLTDAKSAELTSVSQIKNSDAFVRSCMNKSPGELTAADIETTALAFGVFDDLWPMHRFDGVDLSL